MLSGHEQEIKHLLQQIMINRFPWVLFFGTTVGAAEARCK